MQYKILKRANRKYDLSAMIRLELLFFGGSKIKQHASLFIPQHNKEHQLAYADRLSEASYDEFYSYICGYYATTVFEKELTIQTENRDEYYTQFAANCDNNDTEYQDFLKAMFNDALAYRHAWAGVDFPEASNEQALSAADYIAPMAYLYRIDQKDIIDWQFNNFGKLEWIKIHRKYSKPMEPLDSVQLTRTEVKVWSMDGDRAKYQIFAADHKDPDHEYPESFEFQLIKEGITDFRQIPIVCLDIVDGLNFASRISELCADLYRCKTTNAFARRRSAYPIPVLSVAGPDLDGTGDMTPAPTNPEETLRAAAAARSSQGILKIGEKEKLDYLQADAAIFEFLQQSEENIANRIFQLASMSNQAVATNGKQALSAEAKRQDNITLNNNCEEYGSLLRNFSLKLFRLIDEARNQQSEFVALGLDNYNHIDRETAVQEGLSTTVLATNFGSKTFAKLHALTCATNLLNSITAEQESEIMKEIDASIEANGIEPMDGNVNESESDTTDENR